MKKKVNIITKIIIGLILLTILNINTVFAFDTNTFEFEIQNNSEQKEIKLYILLPKEYIEHCIETEKLNIEYKGPETLKENIFETIIVNPNQVENETYKYENQEFVQILLEHQNQKYEFSILESYPKMDIKYRITNNEKDDIIHIDNFVKKDGTCKIIYDYDLNKVNQPTVKVATTSTKIIIALIILIVIIVIISLLKRGE